MPSPPSWVPDKDAMASFVKGSRSPGPRDLAARVADLDQEGIYGEVVYSSIGLWEQSINDRALIRAAAEAENEWKVSEIQGIAPNRLIAPASIPLLDVDDAVKCAIRLGAVPGGPDGGGLPSALDVRATDLVALTKGDPF